jgi:hypothetical protein
MMLYRRCLWILVFVLILAECYLICTRSCPAHGDGPPVLPAVHVRRQLPALKLLLRDNHTMVTVKENPNGVQINITDVQIPKI